MMRRQATSHEKQGGIFLNIVDSLTMGSLMRGILTQRQIDVEHLGDRDFDCNSLIKEAQI